MIATHIVFTIGVMRVLLTLLNFGCFCTHGANSDYTHKTSRANHFLTDNVAKSFLNPWRRLRRSATFDCSNGCTKEEVKEFYGNSQNIVREVMREIKCGIDCQFDSFVYCEITSSSWNEISEVHYRCSRHGGWGTWSAWGACSVTCGTGTQIRSRHCDNPAQLGGGNTCVGSSSTDQSCALTACAVDGAWGSWEQWQSCSVTCDSGTKLRSRVCNNPAPSNGGSNCPGNSQSTIACTLASCPVHGGWASWESWSRCAIVNSNVTRTRCRTCTNPVPAHGGDQCPHQRTQSEFCDIPKSTLRRPCRCPVSRIAEIKNITAEELIELVKGIKKELGVDVSKLSKTVRKKISVVDKRSSTKAIGVLGTVMLTMIVLVISGLDLVTVCRYFRNKGNKVKVNPKK